MLLAFLARNSSQWHATKMLTLGYCGFTSRANLCLGSVKGSWRGRRHRPEKASSGLRNCRTRGDPVSRTSGIILVSIRTLNITAGCCVRLCFGHRFVGNSVSSLRTDVAKPQIRELCVCLVSQPTNSGKPLGQFIAGVGECAMRRDFVESFDIEVAIRPVLLSETLINGAMV